jgi:hypothetical protein
MAIMGASGAGKSTFLDILARKRKKGVVSGTTLVNGREVSDAEFKKVVGFVDQEDTLMSTLTVYETVLYSALLRLPRDMSIEAKKFRTLETMNELGILGIKDMRIGDSSTSLDDVFFLHQSHSLQVIGPFLGAKNAASPLPASLLRHHRYFSWMNPPVALIPITRITSSKVSFLWPVTTIAQWSSQFTNPAAILLPSLINSYFWHLECSFTPVTSISARNTLLPLVSHVLLASTSPIS